MLHPFPPHRTAPRRGRLLLPAVLLLALLAPAGPAPAQQPPTGGGLPLPRFASLAGESINVRTGPGKQYPIRWVYTRLALPVKVVEEFDVWRRIEDHEGAQGWIHGSLLSRRRTVMVVGGIANLYRTPSREARVLLRAEPGVIGRLLDCDSSWCFVDIASRRGWSERGRLWGVLEDEMRR